MNRSALLRRLLVVTIVTGGSLVLIAGEASAATITVNTTDDENNTDGDCSLREAILAAVLNSTKDACTGGSSSGTDAIGFSITGTVPHTIVISSALGGLPSLSNVTIDGTTEPDYVSAPVVALDGQATAAGTSGFNTSSGTANVTVKGLAIYDFARSGVEMYGSNTTIQASYIGTDAAGTAGIGNGYAGIELAFDGAGTIGGTAAGEGNVISGNGATGIVASGSETETLTIAGNRIGTSPDGTASLPNGTDGISIGGIRAPVEIGGTTNVTPTGACMGACNLISANGQYGISVQGSGHVIRGNYIGTSLSGLGDLGNGKHGIRLGNTNPEGVTIGGTTAPERNVVSGNGQSGFGSGIAIEDVNGNHNAILGNYVGVGRDGMTQIGNDDWGIRVQGDANTIGGTTAGAGNVIAASNQADGVFLHDSASGNRILGNSIHSNGHLGIDHRDDGVSLNDIGDGDTFGLPPGNDLQNFPDVTDAFSGNGKTLVVANLDSAPSTDYRVEVFRNTNAGCDPSTNGEAEIFVDSVAISTDVNGDAVIEPLLGQVIAGPLAMTATDLTNATDPRERGETSEFSDCVPVKADQTPPPNPAIAAAPPPGTTTSDNTVQLSWTMPTDLADDSSAGSGLDGYSFTWSTSPSTDPGTTIDAQESVTSENETLADGQHWFHIRTVDRLGNWSQPSHVGPFMIDTTPEPTTPVVNCAGKAATIVGTSGNETLVGTPGVDVIAGLGGNDIVKGLGGDDIVCGGDGNDKINGGGGKDKLLGEAGNDKLKGGGGNDRLKGGPGKDLAVGGGGKDKAPGSEKTRGIP